MEIRKSCADNEQLLIHVCHKQTTIFAALLCLDSSIKPEKIRQSNSIHSMNNHPEIQWMHLLYSHIYFICSVSVLYMPIQAEADECGHHAGDQNFGKICRDHPQSVTIDVEWTWMCRISQHQGLMAHSTATPCYGYYNFWNKRQ